MSERKSTRLDMDSRRKKVFENFYSWLNFRNLMIGLSCSLFTVDLVIDF